jgi:ribosome-associated protein
LQQAQPDKTNRLLRFIRIKNTNRRRNFIDYRLNSFVVSRILTQIQKQIENKKMKLTLDQKDQLIKELTFATSRSQGAGGQNVNKVETRVELNWNPEISAVFSLDEKVMLSASLQNKMNKSGFVFLTSQKTRSQLKNKDDVTDRFFALIERILTPKKPRKATKPTRASQAVRLESKKKKSMVKQLRKRDISTD